MIISERKLRLIVRETLAQANAVTNLDLMVLSVYRKAEERGYLEEYVPAFLRLGVRPGNVKSHRFIHPREGFYKDRGASDNKILGLKPTVEDSLSYDTDKGPVSDIGKAIGELSSFLEMAYTNVKFSRLVEPVHPDAGAVHLLGCYQHLLKAYINLLSEEKKDVK